MSCAIRSYHSQRLASAAHNWRTGPSAKRAQEMMERQVEHLVRLVDDLLEVSRVSHGKIELRKERLDLALSSIARWTSTGN